MKAETTRVSPPRHGQSIAPIVGDEASDDDVASESIQLPWISLVCIDQNESRKMSLADPWSTRKQSVGRDLQSCQKISAKACPGHKRDRNIFRQATYRSKSAVLTYPLLASEFSLFLEIDLFDGEGISIAYSRSYQISVHSRFGEVRRYMRRHTQLNWCPA